MFNEEEQKVKNLYDLLGVDPNASARDIKKAFQKRSLIAHPDKGGSKEQMAALNEAYAVLKDPEKREKFDFEREQFKDEDDAPQPVAGLIQNDWIAFSLQFKQLHASLVDQYRSNLPEFDFENNFQPHKSDLYGEYPDLFTLIQDKSEGSTCYVSTSQEPERINQLLAIDIFIHFLQGEYYGAILTNKIIYLSTELDKTKTINPYALELKLYEGILTVFKIAKQQGQLASGEEILAALIKITDYTKQTDMLSVPFVAPLLQNKYFRNLYAYALNKYWQSNNQGLDHQNLELFNGVDATKTILDSLRLQLSQASGISEDLKRLISTVKTLYKFEQDLAKDADIEQSAKFYRERAYHLLDWFPAFFGMINSHVMTNIFMRIGFYFQLASQLEEQLSIQAADEQLAMQMYMSTFSVARHATPDVELYTYIHSLRLISAFKYQHQHLEEIIPALQRHALKLTDLFPLFSAISPNVDFLVKGQQTLGLMRNLLHTLIHIIEDNRAGESDIKIDHDYVTVLYQAYEACLKNWYEEQNNPASEKRIRTALMDEMLFNKGWTFLDLEENINAPWIMLDQDEDGWMTPSPSLPWHQTPSVEIYRALNGFELNYQNGKLKFLFRKVAANDPEYTRVISAFDLSEMLERNIQGAVFSLDPVDPEILYHPFNQMRFAPNSVYKTEFFNTMLLTDYILKFLTIGREVQGRYPYATRSLAQITQHLPLYLKKVIEDFHESQQSESLHRFWIEAEEIPVAIDEVNIEKNGTRRVAVGDLKMVVKKHVMVRDEHGNLVDAIEKDEGWNFHVLPREEMNWMQVDNRYTILQIPAIIVIEGRNEIYFVENDGISDKFSMPTRRKVYREKLIRLSKLERGEIGKVIKTSQNAYRLYKLTRDITEHCNKPHRFSPEYVFAQEFTAHYDEFAQYYPEFGRLRELSRITVLIKFMNGLRESNKENIARLEDVLNDVPRWRTRGNEITRAIGNIRGKYQSDYDQDYKQVHRQLTTEFARLSRELNYEKLLSAKQEVLRSIQNQIGPLTFSTYSTEVNAICDEMYNENYRLNKDRIIAEHGWYAWNNAESKIASQIRSQVNDQRFEIAAKLGSQKKESYRDQLNEIFTSQLNSLSTYEFRNLIDSFVNGRSQPLANALAKEERAEVEKQIQQSFPDQNRRDVNEALNNNARAIIRIATNITDKKFSQYKEQVNAEISKAENVVPEEKRQLKIERDKLARVEKTFKNLRLGKAEKEIRNLEKKCLWVLSSVRNDPNSRLAHRMVYGGVHVEPRVNQLPPNTPAHQNTLNSAFGGNSVDSSSIIHVTKAGVAIPPQEKYKIPDEYVSNPQYDGSYGIYDRNGKYVERLRVDPDTPPGYKGPNFSHYHLDRKGRHYVPDGTDPGFSSKFRNTPDHSKRNN